jgi:hypothetical protein
MRADSRVSSDQSANAASLAATQLLVNRLRQMRASGRVVLSLTPEAKNVENLPNLPVEDGDRFIVTPKPSSVNVVGAVYEQSSFLFEPQRRVFGYLKQAGGANRDADQKHAFVIRGLTARAVMRSRHLPRRAEWRVFHQIRRRG